MSKELFQAIHDNDRAKVEQIMAADPAAACARSESGVSALMQALGATDYSFVVLMPATIVVTTMLYCSFYATYRGCFGVQTPETTDAPTKPVD